MKSYIMYMIVFAILAYYVDYSQLVTDIKKTAVLNKNLLLNNTYINYNNFTSFQEKYKGMLLETNISVTKNNEEIYLEYDIRYFIIEFESTNDKNYIETLCIMFRNINSSLIFLVVLYYYLFATFNIIWKLLKFYFYTVYKPTTYIYKMCCNKNTNNKIRRDKHKSKKRKSEWINKLLDYVSNENKEKKDN